MIIGRGSQPTTPKFFFELMITFYETGEQKNMNAFLRECLDERVVEIMKEGESKKAGRDVDI